MNTFSAGRAVIVGGDFNLRLSDPVGAENLSLLTSLTDLSNACAVFGIIDEGAIDKFFFRSNEAVTLIPVSCREETDIFVTNEGGPLSDHPPLAVGFTWSGFPQDIDCL